MSDASLRPDLESTIAGLPKAAGVYQFYDDKDRIIYVGKAANLRARVRSYFRKSGDDRFHVARIRKITAKIEVIGTGNEREALLLEDALVKQHQPKFNIKLRDDKSFLFLRLRRDDPFPYVEIVRRPPSDNNPTFGPYPSARAARRTSSVMHKIFPLRTCSNIKFSHRSRPCLDHQIGRCPAPCVGLIEPDAYAEIVAGAEAFLRGDRREAKKHLEQHMQVASEALRFEDAARFRDQLKALEETEAEPVTFQFGSDSVDAWGFARHEDQRAVIVLRLSEGRVLHSDVYGGVAISESEDWETVLLQYYRPTRFIPAQVLLPERPPFAEQIESILSDRRGKKVQLKAPERGSSHKLIKLAADNAATAVRTRVLRDYDQVAAQVERTLHLPRPPLEIECYDVSVHQGADPVGVRVVFSLGEENSDARRRYRLTAGDGQGDVQWMWEMLERRLRRGIEENNLPDLIVLDGGLAQLNAVTKLCAQLEIEWRRVPVVALAKARDDQPDVAHNAERGMERVFLPGRKNPVVLKPGTATFDLLVRLRDATHNAAVGYHRNRSRNRLVTGLERIPGLGPERRKRLLDSYPDPAAIVHQPLEEVRRATGIPIKVLRDVQAELAGLQ